MKRTIVIAIFAAAAAMVCSSATAQGRSKATIPFSFRVGSALMPAGTYLVEYPQTRVISFRNLDGGENALALASTTSGDVAPPKKLVFNRYGSAYFLSATLTAGGESEMTFAATKLERNIREEEANLQNRSRTLVALN